MYLLVIQIKRRLIVRHHVHQMIPVRRPQRFHVVRETRRIQLIPHWVIVQIRLLQIHNPVLVIDNHSRRALMIAIHVVNPITRIQIVIRRHRWPNVRDIRGSSEIGRIVEHLELIEMCVPEELRRYGALIACDDFVVIPRPHFQTIRMTGRNMPDNMHLLVGELSGLQFIDEPLQLGGRIGAVQQQPPVLVVAVVHVQRDDAKTGPHQHRVECTASHRMRDAGRQPMAPLNVELIVQPRNGAVQLLHIRRWETVHGSAFVIAQRRENRNAGEFLSHLFDGVLENVQVLVFGLVPDVVRRQIAGPEDVVDVLYRFYRYKSILSLDIVHQLYPKTLTRCVSEI